MFGVSLSNTEKLSVLGNLATMLGAGIPIVESVNSLLEDTTGNQRKVLLKLRDDLMQGKKIADSFAQFPKVFDKVTTNLLRASEEAGTLEITLKDLRDHIQTQIEFTDKIKFALIYPALIMVVFIGVLGVILFFVVPKISSVFLRLKVDLPLPTKILVWLSQTLLNYTGLVILIFSVSVFLLWFIYQKNKQFLIEIALRLPILSGLLQQIDLAQFTRSMALLLNSGIPIATALSLGADVVLGRKIAKLIAKCREMVMSGRPMSEGLKLERGIVPVLMIKLTEAGERTGTLDRSMQQIAQHLDYEVSNSLKAVTAILEPVMLVIVGVSVGGMMLAIIAPIYGLIGQVGGR